MRKPQQLSHRQSAKQLMRTLEASTALPAFIKTLKTPVLKRLIDYVGLRDAGELIALTTTNQLREVFEEVLWQTLVPGQAEGPQPEMFLQWLDVLLEVSPAFAAQRLIELGETFVVLHFAPLIRVREQGFGAPDPDDDDAANIEDARQREEFGTYIVTAAHDDEWDARPRRCRKGRPR